MAKEQEYEISTDSYHATGTLEYFKGCWYDEEDLYHVKGTMLYYDDIIIGHAI